VDSGCSIFISLSNIRFKSPGGGVCGRALDRKGQEEVFPCSGKLPGDIPASHMGSRSTTPLLRNPTDVRHCSQHAGADVDFGDEGAVDWALLGNLKQLRALLLG
jgi:hypothetical protein